MSRKRRSVPKTPAMKVKKESKKLPRCVYDKRHYEKKKAEMARLRALRKFYSAYYDSLLEQRILQQQNYHLSVHISTLVHSINDWIELDSIYQSREQLNIDTNFNDVSTTSNYSDAHQDTEGHSYVSRITSEFDDMLL